MDFGAKPFLGKVEDRTDGVKRALMGAIFDNIGTQQLRQYRLNDPELAAALPHRDKMNVAEGRRNYMQALFDKATRLYGSTSLHDPRKGPGGFGRSEMEAQMLDPRLGITPEQHQHQVLGILRAAYPDAFRAADTNLRRRRN